MIGSGGESRWRGKQTDATTQKWLIGLLVFCIGAGMADRLYEKHPHVEFEGWFNFYGFSAAFFTAALIATAMIIVRFIERKEGYYDE